MIRPCENCKPPPPPLSPQKNFFVCQFNLYQLDIVPSYHPMKFKGKLMNQTRENCKRPYFGLDFGWPKCGPAKFVPQVLSLLVVRNCFKLSSYAICSNANEPNLRKRAKNNNFGSNCSPFGTNQDPKRLQGLFTSTSIKGLYQVIVLCNLKKT